jgi:hypothetical protein
MKVPLLRLAAAGVLGGVAAGLVWASCRSAADGAGSPPPGGAETEAGEPSLSAQLAGNDAALKVLDWSLATRRAIADEVIARRMTLREAAAGFDAVDQVKARYLPAVDSLTPGKTAEERLCRRVLDLVSLRLEGSDKRETVVGRLEAELHKHLQRQGGVRLPKFRRPESIPWFDP